MVDRLRFAHALLILLPAALLGGALAFQYLGGLYPCEMCIWQRWPHIAALLVAGGALMVSETARRPWLLLAALAVAISGTIGIFHVGVEQQWWQGLSSCSVIPVASGNLATDIFAVPLVRCDQVAWSLFGISMAGYNALLSLTGALVATWLLTRPARAA